MVIPESDWHEKRLTQSESEGKGLMTSNMKKEDSMQARVEMQGKAKWHVLSPGRTSPHPWSLRPSVWSLSMILSLRLPCILTSS